jgi:hypothetical protein
VISSIMAYTTDNQPIENEIQGLDRLCVSEPSRSLTPHKQKAVCSLGRRMGNAICLRPEESGTHSPRRTKASMIYRATGNIQILLVTRRSRTLCATLASTWRTRSFWLSEPNLTLSGHADAAWMAALGMRNEGLRRAVAGWIPAGPLLSHGSLRKRPFGWPSSIDRNAPHSRALATDHSSTQADRQY